MTGPVPKKNRQADQPFVSDPANFGNGAAVEHQEQRNHAARGEVDVPNRFALLVEDFLERQRNWLQIRQNALAPTSGHRAQQAVFSRL